VVDEVAVSGHESHLVGLRHTARLEVFGGKLSSGGCQPSEVFSAYEVAVSGRESHSVGLRHTARLEVFGGEVGERRVSTLRGFCGL
jgi:hypothetical protein